MSYGDPSPYRQPPSSSDAHRQQAAGQPPIPTQRIAFTIACYAATLFLPSWLVMGRALVAGGGWMIVVMLVIVGPLTFITLLGGSLCATFANSSPAAGPGYVLGMGGLVATTVGVILISLGMQDFGDSSDFDKSSILQKLFPVVSDDMTNMIASTGARLLGVALLVFLVGTIIDVSTARSRRLQQI